MIIVRDERFIENASFYVEMASKNEEVEVLCENGVTLVLKNKNKED